jgi:recombination protein RecT
MGNRNDLVPKSGAIVESKKELGAIAKAYDSERYVNSQYFTAKILALLKPHKMDADAFKECTVDQFYKNPRLKSCTIQTLNVALLRCARLGILPDGWCAHLVPFKNSKLSKEAGKDVYDVTLVIDYKGFNTLAIRSGYVSCIHSEIVRANDYFTYENGIVKHRPNIFAPTEERGAIVGVYAVARMHDGAEKFEVMNLEQVYNVRGRSASYQASQKFDITTPWDTDPEEMIKKTVVRRLIKYIPTTPELSIAATADNEDYAGNSDFIDVTPISRKGDIFQDEGERSNPQKQLEVAEADVVDDDEVDDGDEEPEVAEPPKERKRIKVKVRADNSEEDDASSVFD